MRVMYRAVPGSDSIAARGASPGLHSPDGTGAADIALYGGAWSRGKRGTALASATYTPARRIHPVHAVLLASSLPLFLGALLSDWAYSSTQEIQWLNFAAWMIVGALVFAGAALLWAAIDVFRADVGRGRSALYTLVLLTMFVLGFINALVHAKDGWATMPAGLILSVLTALLAFCATWLGFSTLRAGATR